MRSKSVRLALLAYPRRWRRQHGDEFEEFTTWVWMDQTTLSGRALTLSDVVGHGLSERLRSTEAPIPRTTLTWVAAMAATAVVMVGGLTADSLYRNVPLAPGVQLGAHVTVINSPEPRHPKVRSGSVVVYAPPGSNTQVSISGPVDGSLNTATAQITSLRPAFGSQRKRWRR